MENEWLHFCVAEHCFSIETSCAKKTRELLPSFSSFETKGSEKEKPLFCLSQGEVPSGDGFVKAESSKGAKIALEIFRHPDGRILINLRTPARGSKQACLSSNRDRIITNASPTNPEDKLFIISFIKLAYCVSATPFATLKMHASVIEKDGRALLFLGTSGTGKSTHSQLWLKYVAGCSLVNDDEPIVRVTDGKVYVYGAPWSGKTPCYRQTKAEVAAMVRLYQHPENKLEKLNGEKALAPLLEATPFFHQDKQYCNQALFILMDIGSIIPIYRLDCRPDEEAVRFTESLLVE